MTGQDSPVRCLALPLVISAAAVATVHGKDGVGLVVRGGVGVGGVVVGDGGGGRGTGQADETFGGVGLLPSEAAGFVCGHLLGSVFEWWDKRTDMQNPNRCAMASLTMFVSWTIWNERNSRVFRHKSAPPPILL